MINNDAKDILQMIKDCDGAEIHKDDWPILDELRNEGYILVGGARGPGNAFKRATLKPS